MCPVRRRARSIAFVRFEVAMQSGFQVMVSNTMSFKSWAGVDDGESDGAFRAGK